MLDLDREGSLGRALKAKYNISTLWHVVPKAPQIALAQRHTPFQPTPATALIGVALEAGRSWLIRRAVESGVAARTPDNIQTYTSQHLLHT